MLFVCSGYIYICGVNFVLWWRLKIKALSWRDIFCFYYYFLMFKSFYFLFSFNFDFSFCIIFFLSITLYIHIILCINIFDMGTQETNRINVYVKCKLWFFFLCLYIQLLTCSFSVRNFYWIFIINWRKFVCKLWHCLYFIRYI